jgi:hypothetical protein
LSKVKPKDVGINLYFTCDETSKLEQVFNELYPDANQGDSGSSSSDPSKVQALPKNLDVIEELPEEEYKNRLSANATIVSNDNLFML